MAMLDSVFNYQQSNLMSKYVKVLNFQSTSAENPMENPPLLQGIWHQHPGNRGDGVDPLRARWAIASQHHDEPGEVIEHQPAKLEQCR